MMRTIHLFCTVISEIETRQLEATNNELKKKVQNLEATYREEGKAKNETERRVENARKTGGFTR